MQPGSPYQQMLLQQANGAVYLSPHTSHAAQYSALQSQLAHPNALVALQQHQQQQYQQVSLASEWLLLKIRIEFIISDSAMDTTVIVVIEQSETKKIFIKKILTRFWHIKLNLDC